MRAVLVVHGDDGMDELTTTGPCTMQELRDGVVTSRSFDPGRVGLPLVGAEAVRGGDPATNAALADRVLAGERGPHRDIVPLNAAAALVVGGATDSLEAGLVMAADVVDDGRAAAALERLRASSVAASEADEPG